MTLTELRAGVGASEPERRMLAAIDAVAALVGDDLRAIAPALFGAYITVAHATGHGPEMVAMTIETLQASLADMTRGVPS